MEVLVNLQELNKSEKEKIQKELGKTYIIVQEYEYSIKYFLWLLSSLKFIKFDIETATNFMENIDKKTIGQILRCLKGHVELNEDDDIMISDALHQRNEFIHDFYIRKIETLVSIEGRNLFFNDLKEIREKISKSNKNLIKD